ncbi:MAG TPA: 30S ribosomal protein S2, partial [Salinibacter sp.]|nr:30S ribosomal protein S2 [Salinibacter sp.]
MADENASTQDPDTSKEDAPEAAEAEAPEEAEDASSEADAEAPTDEGDATADDDSDTEDTSTAHPEVQPDEADPEKPTVNEDELVENGDGEAAEDGEASHRATIEDLLKAGAHFGHLTSRWNPRMEKHIFMERNNIHIIDLMQTQVLLDRAAEAAKRFARRGKKILFAGTKKQAQDIVREHAEDCGMPHMVDRWLGGTMTNFQTIRKSIRRMEEIERMERDGTLDKLKKKEKLVRLREHEKLENTLGGIRNMANLPGAIFIVDVKREEIAVSEARNLGIPIIAMVDTNGNPKKIDYPVPVND